MYELTILETAAKLKMPIRVLAKWRSDRVLDGVPHPSYKTKAGGNIRYSAEEIDQIELPKADYFPQPEIRPEVWTRAMVVRHGVSALLSCAILGPVRYRTRDFGDYLIQRTGSTKSGSESARGVLGKYSVPLSKVSRIESKHDFPGVQFSVEKIG